MKRISIILSLAMSTMLLPVYGQEGVVLGVDLSSYFDNKEYANNSVNSTSGTDYASRFIPYIKAEWDNHNTFVFGAEAYMNYGEPDDGKFFNSVKPILYYKFENENVRATSGLFTRNILDIESYSTAFFSRNYLFYHNRMGGLMGSYRSDSGNSYTELAIDWEGKYTTVSREKFRFLSSGHYKSNILYCKYAATMLHYAGQDDGVNTNVVDYLLINPAVGLNYSAAVNWDFKVGVLASAQRDRAQGSGWKSPMMGEITAKIEYKGFSVKNELYIGGNMCPFYEGFTTNSGNDIIYGLDLYPGDGFFRTDGAYNRFSLRYKRLFYNDSVSVDSEIVLHKNKYGMASQYLVNVCMKFHSDAYLVRK